MLVFLAITGLILSNSFLALAELSLIAAKKPRLFALAEEGDTAAGLAFELAAKPDKIIATAQIGLTFLVLVEGAVTGSLLNPVFSQMIGQIPLLKPFDHLITLVCSFTLITSLTILFGDIIPKRIALVYPETIAVKLIPITSKVIYCFSPLVKIFSYLSDKILTMFGIPITNENTVSAEDIEDIFEAGAQSGLLVQTEKDLLDNVWRMDERQVSALMTPRSEIVYVDLSASLEDNVEIILNNPAKDIIVCNENLDHVIGIAPAKIWLKDIFRQMRLGVASPKISWSENLTPVHTIPNSLSLIETLDSFRQFKTHIALVYNEFGHVEGIISVSDLMNAVVGEYPGMNSENLLIIKDVSGKWLIDGMAAIDDVKQALEIEELPNEQLGHYNTAAGFALSILGRAKGRLPKEFDRFTYEGYLFEVVDIDRTQGYRIDRLMVQRAPEDNLLPTK
jgi:putative hemolysin